MRRPAIVVPSIILISLALAAGLQSWMGTGAFAPGWLASSLLLALGGIALWAGWKLAGGGKQLAWMIALAFFLRLVFGAAMSQVLPVAGNPTPEQQAGYLSKDAFVRDNEAWKMAISGQSLAAPLNAGQYGADQYGGLLRLSALVYRALSPDAHRAYLIILLAAVFGGLGIPFFWAAVRPRWGDTAAAVGGWILALYPESVFWGASQMREPFLISLIAGGYWAAVNLRRKPAAAGTALVLSLAGMYFISSPVALATLGVLVIYLWLEYLPGQEKPFWRWAGWLSLALGAVLLVGATWSWLRISAVFDINTTIHSSGWLQYYTRLIGDNSRIPITVAYGLIRPLLPAAAIEPSILTWRLIFIWRALGWYIILPVLIYAFTALWRVPDRKDRFLVIWVAAVVMIWSLVSAARGGGDSNDNPRYRVIFLVWMALLAGWALDWAKARQFRWLVRWGMVDVVFLLLFTQVYLWRYTPINLGINLYQTVVMILVFSLIILGGGWVLDRRRINPPAENSSGKPS